MPLERSTGTTPTTKRDKIEFANHHHPEPRTKDFSGDAVWMENRYKLVKTKKATELFDISADPLEKRDLAKDKPATVKRMTNALEDWQRSVEQSLSGADYT